MQGNKKFVFVAIAIAVLIILAVATVLFLILSKKESPHIEGEIVAPKEGAAEVDEFLEFPKEVRPLLQDSLDEALEDIEALGL